METKRQHLKMLCQVSPQLDSFQPEVDHDGIQADNPTLN